MTSHDVKRGALPGSLVEASESIKTKTKGTFLLYLLFLDIASSNCKAEFSGIVSTFEASKKYLDKSFYFSSTHVATMWRILYCLLVLASYAAAKKAEGTGGTPHLRRLEDGQIAWPQSDDLGPKITAAPPPVSYDGRGRALPVIADKTMPCPGGRTCFVRDSKGAWLLPGPNLWDPGDKFIWMDNGGLHLNVRPRNGCGDWASSEAWDTKPLGYGS